MAAVTIGGGVPLGARGTAVAAVIIGSEVPLRKRETAVIGDGVPLRVRG